MPDYGYKVHFVPKEVLAKVDLDAYAGHPFIFDSRPGYARLPNQFLIDRGMGYWDPKWRGAKRNPIPPSRVSMKNFAHWLSNALEWADTRSVYLMQSDYVSDLIGRYQKEMLEGIWSVENEPLRPKTINARVQIALEYQMWASDKGLREQFIIPTTTSTHVAGSFDNSKSHEAKVFKSRKGKVRDSDYELSFPSEKDIHAWRDRVYERPVVGSTEGLIVDLILNTAIRREEASCWRVDTLPLDRKDWCITNRDQPEEFQSVIVTVKYGAKGKEYGIDEHGDKIGPEGKILVPMWLALSIDDYRDGQRHLVLNSLVKSGKGIEAQRRLLQRSVHLFLNPETGLRYTGEQIYGLWSRQADKLAHWSPHKGRHWWACSYLEKRMQQHADLIQHILKIPNLSRDHPMVLALKDTVQTVIQMEIRPQLRHVGTQTTEIYLRWLFEQKRIPMSMTKVWVAVGDEVDGDEK